MKNYFGILTIGLATFLTGCSGETAPPPTPNHLIMLTETDDGKADASFMAVETLEECERRAGVAKNVFPSAGIKYISHYCTNAETKFEPFGHEPVPTGDNYIFDLQFSKDGKTLEKVILHPSMDACENAKSRLCVISYQNKL